MKLSNIKAVIIDWAGTSIDYGSYAPVAAFIDAFSQFGIEIYSNEVRLFMGFDKKEHTKKILNLDRITELWFDRFKRKPNKDDADKIFDTLSSSLKKVIVDYSVPIDGSVDFVEKMKSLNIKVGSTTGYVRDMMNDIVNISENKGLRLDCIVTPSEVPNGRPYPWMCYLNAIIMQVYPMANMVKIGDTVADIQEGINAGMWTVGITQSGNEVGLTNQEINNLNKDELNTLLKKAEQNLTNAGAHVIIKGIWEAEIALEEINNKISAGLKP